MAAILISNPALMKLQAINYPLSKLFFVIFTTILKLYGK